MIADMFADHDVDDDPAPAVTRRLTLRVPTRADVPEIFELYADPQVWGPDPLSRHDSVTQTERMIDNWRAAWRRDGLGMWVARGAEPGSEDALVGIGGCFVRYGVAWNLGFRLVPRFWGRGYAQEISAAAIAGALGRRPELPMTAYLLAGNERSQRATERAGLRLVWRGPDAGNPDLHAVRLLFADRDLSPEVVQALTEA
jgi:RimJ/RimL family protein N-acetyltransferase